MSEFSPAPDTPITAQRPPPVAPKDRLDWINRPMFLGLSLPWLVGIAILLGAAGWYLFAPERPSQVNALAFGDGGGMQPVQNATQPPAHVDTGFDVPQTQPAVDIAEVVVGVREYAEANRAAIEQLSRVVKTQATQAAVLSEQLKEAQAQVSVLSARLSSLETKPRQATKPVVKSVATTPSSSPLSEMRVSAAQVGMAWVNWQNKTWAVQVGDSLLDGKVTITAIDAASRQVHTSAGTIK